MNRKNIAVLGAGSFGTAFAQVLANNGHQVHLWNWEGDPAPLKEIKSDRENKTYLPGVALSENITPIEDIEEALDGVVAVFLAIPSANMAQTITLAVPYITKDMVIVDLSKGFDPDTMTFTPDMIARALPESMKDQVVAISGPAVAKQMALGGVTLMNITSTHVDAVHAVQALVESSPVRLIATEDLIGVEVGGACKNVYAIAMGMCDALGYGLNTKAALLTYAIKEIATVVEAMGGKKETAYDLAGLGDLIGTALAPESRNRRFGEYLGQGDHPDIACEKVAQIVEGIDALDAMMLIKKQHHLFLPFTEMISACVCGEKAVKEAMEEFIQSL
ncbi:NAD(P)H-dependent glycerol-3-phosphate dehydrogenase [Patescibacteria group bacterium]|nr:NAD(P)H-dependent glycerol-3-phosphate dehydrogenase [Patescibacteria group bacterium]MBU1721481.1 NAD(P)H-dependent glycerol-3-phosphate dehydrogenase [Patescibacteria group bacterium]MBU1900752.1 NAD(P)H-dependent glycerol-3-phosphate dehydrogenase [Patescibacteria group bacterium]